MDGVNRRMGEAFGASILRHRSVRIQPLHDAAAERNPHTVGVVHVREDRPFRRAAGRYVDPLSRPFAMRIIPCPPSHIHKAPPWSDEIDVIRRSEAPPGATTLRRPLSTS